MHWSSEQMERVEDSYSAGAGGAAKTSTFQRRSHFRLKRLKNCFGIVVSYNGCRNLLTRSASVSAIPATWW
ncbi:hypothetical protein [Parasitella parasitica]|nr:hypothetical protein [Parasitella parasitica]